LAHSLPSFLVERLIRPALVAGSSPTVLAEEWQTSGTVIALADQLRTHGLADGVHVLWRAGSTYGWDNVDWERLNASARIGATTSGLREALTARGVPCVLVPDNPYSVVLAFNLSEETPSADPLRRLRSRRVVRRGGSGTVAQG
jgi:hypothetical protein